VTKGKKKLQKFTKFLKTDEKRGEQQQKKGACAPFLLKL
jgi:hypothetical protein